MQFYYIAATSLLTQSINILCYDSLKFSFFFKLCQCQMCNSWLCVRI